MFSNCSDCCSPDDGEGTKKFSEGAASGQFGSEGSKRSKSLVSHSTHGQLDTSENLQEQSFQNYSSQYGSKTSRLSQVLHTQAISDQYESKSSHFSTEKPFFQHSTVKADTKKKSKSWFNMFSNCSDCCPLEGNAVDDYGFDEKTVISTADRSRAKQLSEETERKWKSINSYQPIDTITKTIEIPVTSIREKYVPKITIEEKVVEVPKYIYEQVEKIVEVPEIKYVDKIIEKPQYHYQYKYIPKIETKENIVQKPKLEIKYIEKIIEVPQIKEVVRYQDVETVEEVIRYVPKGQDIPQVWAQPPTETVESKSETPSSLKISEKISSSPNEVLTGTKIPGTPFLAYPSITESSQAEGTRIEQIFRPKVVKNVEIQKHVPVSVDVPVPYMVPKPLLVPIHVPVLKFRDHFVPVPVRKVIVPKIKWTNEVYEVECIREKPFLQIQDIIKPVPCDVEISVHEYVDKAQPINPTELSQADVHAMWMRVNADLAEDKKHEMGENYPTVQHPPGTVFGEPGTGIHSDENDSPDPEVPQYSNEISKNFKEQSSDPMSLHPGHPLTMTYLQNQWMKKTTTDTQDMYTPEWFSTHQKAVYDITMQNPSQTQLSPERAAMFKSQNPAFGSPQWDSEESTIPNLNKSS